MVTVRTRAGIILLQDRKIALIERERKGKTFFVIPGGSVEKNENTRQAAIRIGKEDLGINTEIERLVAVVEISKGEDHWLQLYYLVQRIAGEFGKETTEEVISSRGIGTLKHVWMPWEELVQHKIHPKPLAALLAKGAPRDILHITESHSIHSS